MTKLSLPLSAISHYLGTKAKSHNEDILLICHSEEVASLYYKQAQFFAPDLPIYFFPSWDSLPYDRISPSGEVLSSRSRILSTLGISVIPAKAGSHETKDMSLRGNDNGCNISHTVKQARVVIMSAGNLLQKLPSSNIFLDNTVHISKGGDLSQEKISLLLVRNGFLRTASADDPGEFSIKGEIIDIVISQTIGYRINFAWDKIDKIKLFDPLTQISSKEISEFSIYPASEFILNGETIANFKSGFLKHFGVNHSRNPLYLSISESRIASSVEHLLPLLYEEMFSIKDYLNNPYIILDPLAKQAILEKENEIADFYRSRMEGNKAQISGFYPALPANSLYFSDSEISEIIKNADVIENQDTKEYSKAPNFYLLALQHNRPVVDLLTEFLSQHKDKKVVFCCSSNSGAERLKNLLSTEGLYNLDIQIIHLQSSFITSGTLFLSQYDVLGAKSVTAEKSSGNNKKLKNVFTELENLTEGELISHNEHGIGMFMGIETLTIAGQPHDCVKLLYADNNRLYIPVENLDEIKRYGSDEGALDSLGGLAWQKRKAKIKERISALTEQLMKLAAVRHLKKTKPIIITEEYNKFANEFPYNETDDQLNAIESIKDDLMSGIPMDRLICGDVGFGKTEVAMRGAFLAAMDGKQVAVISPTTILCRQHYISFVERFRNTGLKIAQLSRLISPSDAKKVKEALGAGEIDIIVGTHALLANDIAFHDLGMIIVDEEQRFGVAQKEKLKELKAGVHILTLSATPIPRTLQMSLIGLKDLSFIATPPVDRLSVRTSVISYDPLIIRDALLREHFRGGRSFYVSPKIKDLDEIALNLKSLVPELTYRMAHGRMSPAAIDEIMGDFYDGKFDILLCTTIIESGIDIPAAGTIIINKSEYLGLSQLYQLRGRVGRSKARGYAYLSVSNIKNATKHAVKRLDIMQNLDSLGAGFAIASHDMDIRGFGNLVGDEQSGHVKEVGVELYQDMLEEAINRVKGEGVIEDDINPSINLGLPISIPEEYIGDKSLRIGLYRRVSAISSKDELENFRDELIDRFGALPLEVENLISVIEIKQICKKLHIESLDSGPQGFVIKFRDGYDPTDLVMGFIMQNPRHSKIRPDHKFVVLKKLDSANILFETLALFKALEMVRA